MKVLIVGVGKGLKEKIEDGLMAALHRSKELGS
jgi:hypothetical protein